MKIRTKSSIQRHIPVIHGGKNPLKNSDHNIIDFSSNITPLGIPNSAKLIIKKKLSQLLVNKKIAKYNIEIIKEIIVS